jgi:dihydroorotate dehydrogenase (NAD+) catalytic subunit
VSTVTVGSLTFPAPVMTASGTAGHGAELAGFMPLAELGAVVVKSLAAFEWAGNPSPRVHPAGTGMINAVGLQGPGVEHWLAEDLRALLATGARVVASIWGRSVDEYRRAAEQLAAAPDGVVAVEINLSCPNLEGRRGIFAHTDRVVEVAAAVHDAGAEAVTLVNTLLGLVLDPHTGLPALGAGGGGYSGAPMHPVAVRTVFDVRAALPTVPIVGVGGVVSAWDAVELLLAGADAVQVGTATFADPAAPVKVQRGLLAWCAERGIAPSELSGLSHRGGLPPHG